MKPETRSFSDSKVVAAGEDDKISGLLLLVSEGVSGFLASRGARFAESSGMLVGIVLLRAVETEGPFDCGDGTGLVSETWSTEHCLSYSATDKPCKALPRISVSFASTTGSDAFGFS